MNKRPASPRRRTASHQPANDPPDRQGIRWRLVGSSVGVFAALAALAIYSLGLWPALMDVTAPTTTDPVQTDPAQTAPALRPARLTGLPTTAEFPPVEQLRAEADQLSQNLRDRFPDSANAFHVAARQAVEFRQYEDAARWWRRAMELAPQAPAPQTGLARVELEQGNAAEAIKILQPALQKGVDSAEIYALFVQGLQDTGELEKALVACNTGLGRYPDDLELLEKRGQIHMQQQQLVPARKDLERIIELNPQALSARSSLATVLARLDEPQLAAQQRDQSEQLKSADPLADKDFDEIYRAAMQQIVVDTLLDAAQEFKRQGDIEAAERLLVRVLTLQPVNAAACKALVTLYREQSRIGDAYTVQERLVKLQPTAAHLINLAGFAMPLQKFGEAEAALSAAIQLDPNSMIAHRTLAMLYLQSDHLQDAKSHAEQVCRIGGSSQDYQLLAQICLRLKDESGYQAALQQAEAASGR